MDKLQIAAWVELGICWIVWVLAFVKPRKRASGAVKKERAPASRWGIFLVMLGYACIWAFVRPVGFEKSAISLIASMIIGPPSVVLVWIAADVYKRQGGGTMVDAEYLEVIAIRGDKETELSNVRSFSRNRELNSRRAEILADRIEEGAARLAEFAGRLSEFEWNTPVTEGGKHGRTVGVVVHHVATVYPIEVDLARTISGGNAITQVTWEAISELNSGHATENAKVSKEETLELLRKNSEEAASAVRKFTDAELDRAAPFSLSFGAPVTAQFVIEDHAVRHSWHHLARIRKVVGDKGKYPTSNLS